VAPGSVGNYLNTIKITGVIPHTTAPLPTHSKMKSLFPWITLSLLPVMGTLGVDTTITAQQRRLTDEQSNYKVHEIILD